MLPGIAGSLVSAAFATAGLSARFAGDLGEVGRADALRRLFTWQQRSSARLGPASSPRSVLDIAVLPLVAQLGYEVDHVQPLPGAGFTGQLVWRGRTAAAMLSLSWGAPVESAWRDGVRAGVRSGARWVLACNGTCLTLIDAEQTWSRRVLSFDLALALRHEQSAQLLWALARAEALASSGTAPPLLDRVVDASDHFASAVCTSLGTGVLDALTELMGALDQAGRRRSGAVGLDHALTIVYRILFLLFAEARGLVPAWHRVYREAYTIDSLCRRIAARGCPPGLWEALQAITRLAHEGCRAGDLRVAPFNGRLFSPTYAPLAARAQVSDRVTAKVLLALATSQRRDGRERIAYADLGVEQLGAVYERVLEYEPVPAAGSLGLRRTSTTRKSTGTFYTPKAITDFLVRRALHPLVSGRTSEEILTLRIVDPAMGSGAFLVSACHYMADALEQSLLREGSWCADDVTESRRAALRRQVAERCLYGVDLNPTAVQVARLSLWLSTLAGDRPLSFLDHHLAVGNSLIGARLSDLTRPAVPSGRARRTRHSSMDLFAEAAVAAMAMVVPERFKLSLDAGDSVAAVREKERRLAALDAPDGPLARWKAVADVWCAAALGEDTVLTSAVVGEITAHLLARGTSLSRAQVMPLVDRARDLSRARRCLHWELTFPEVFFDQEGAPQVGGGFDAVIGNPPWEVLRADLGPERERDHARRSLASLVRFVRDAGVYTLGGTGHPNQYQLFLERSLQLLRPAGRYGLILPAGLASDHGSVHLRRSLLTRTTIETLTGFDNRGAIFPIHRSTRFLLTVGAKAGETRTLRCRFGLHDPSTLGRLSDDAREDPPDAHPIRIDRGLLEAWDPSMAIPELASPLDLAIHAQLHATVPRLNDSRGWHARFGRELNATDDRRHFVARPAEPNPQLLPVVEGKCLEPFRMSLHRATSAIPRSGARTLIDPNQSFERARVAYRDVAARTNRLTLIAAILPPGVVSTHTVFCLKSVQDEPSSLVLLGLLNSLVANYLVRLRVATHVTSAMMARLPVPYPEARSPVAMRLETLTRRLQVVGIEGDPAAYAELNAVAARLYALSEEQYRHVVGTFPLLSEELRALCVRCFEHVRGHRDTETQRRPGGPAAKRPVGWESTRRTV